MSVCSGIILSVMRLVWTSTSPSATSLSSSLTFRLVCPFFSFTFLGLKPTMLNRSVVPLNALNANLPSRSVTAYACLDDASVMLTPESGSLSPLAIT